MGAEGSWSRSAGWEQGLPGPSLLADSCESDLVTVPPSHTKGQPVTK